MSPPPAPLTDGARADWLQLARSDGIGPRTFAGLLARFGHVAAAIEALPALARRRAGVALAPRDGVLREIEDGQRRGLRFIAMAEPDYPPGLREIESAPPIVTVRGRVDVLHRPMVAIVGSRNASAPGLLFTEALARGIAAAGCIIVSGLARGIDAKAHRASLRTGTVAVLAGGHDRIYPSEHVDFAAEIAESGAVLSEMPLGWEPRARDFPRRNRLVSGLALATVVVEAARRSGSLITARFANEQGREVFAVPGSPLDPRAEGTNDLIRQGATLCTSPDDILDALERIALRTVAPAAPQRSLWEASSGDPDPLLDDDDGIAPAEREDDDAGRIEALLGPAPVGLDDLVRLSGLSASRVRAILFDLELSGRAWLSGGLVTGRGSARA